MLIPRWVIDTNVLVSAALTPDGICDQVLQCAVAGLFLPAWDHKILLEYREVLSRPKFKLSKTVVKALLNALPSAGFHRGVPIKTLQSLELPDSEDLPFVAVAIATPHKTIVTGNPSHYPQEKMQDIGVDILSPRQALHRLGR